MSEKDLKQLFELALFNHKKGRLLEAKKEIQQGNNFDFLIVNDIFEDALKDLKTVILGNGHIPKERQSIAKECVSGLLEL